MWSYEDTPRKSLATIEVTRDTRIAKLRPFRRRICNVGSSGSASKAATGDHETPSREPANL